MIQLSKRDLVDIEEIVSKMQFHKAIKKQIEYKFINDMNLDEMPSFSYTISDKHQKIDTYTSDGKETTNTAENGDIIFSGPSKEKYILKPSKVKKMYVGEIGRTLIPEQSPREVSLYKGEDVKFKAPWGELMILKSGDYLVKEQDGSGYYRIAKNEFEETYEIKD